MEKYKTTLLKMLPLLLDNYYDQEYDDGIDILNHACDRKLQKYQLPYALKYIQDKRPEWYDKAWTYLFDIKAKLGLKNDIESLIDIIKTKYDKTFLISKLEDDFNDISDLVDYLYPIEDDHPIGNPNGNDDWSEEEFETIKKYFIKERVANRTPEQKLKIELMSIKYDIIELIDNYEEELLDVNKKLIKAKEEKEIKQIHWYRGVLEVLNNNIVDLKKLIKR